MGVVKSGETYAAKSARAVSRISDLLYDALCDGTLSIVDRTAETFLKENANNIFAISPELDEYGIRVNFHFPKPKNYKNRTVTSLQISGTFADKSSVTRHSLSLLARVNDAIKNPAEPIKEVQRSQ